VAATSLQLFATKANAAANRKEISILFFIRMRAVLQKFQEVMCEQTAPILTAAYLLYANSPIWCNGALRYYLHSPVTWCIYG
jgi:hypothetical protein